MLSSNSVELEAASAAVILSSSLLLLFFTLGCLVPKGLQQKKLKAKLE